MSETAAHLIDNVLPKTPIRQWVISFPFSFRLCLAVRPKIMAKALSITHSAIEAFYRKKAGLSKASSKTGAVTLIQRFGGSLNVNPHFHMLFIDGIYELGADLQPTGFVECREPTVPQLEEVLAKIIRRLTRYLERQKIIVKDEDGTFQLQIDEDDTLSKLQASSVTYRFATGPSAGKKALVLKSIPEGDHNSSYGLVAKNSGFSMHAGVNTDSHERDKLEKICRYIARPAISEERLSTNSVGDVVYRFKKPWDDGTTAIKLTPLEFMEKLAALVPRPRVHLTRFHGVLGPHYKYRKLIVPAKLQLTKVADDSDPTTAKRITWARLLKRIFAIDVEICPKCQGPVKIIAAVEDPVVIKKILEHLGLASTPPKILPATGPPLFDQDYFKQESYDF